MAFETINPGGTPSSGPIPEPIAPKAAEGAVSVEDALKGAQHTKSNVFSVSDMAKGPNGPTPGIAGSSVTAGQLVSGKIAVDMMDAIFPAILVVIFARIGVAIKKTSLQLTQGEKNTLEPIMSSCLNTINMDFSSPWQALAVTMLFIYGGKALEVGGVGWLDKKAAKATPADPAKHEKAVVVPMTKSKTKPVAGSGVSGVKINTPADNSNNLTDFHPDGPTTWSEADVAAVEKKRKRGRAEAITWLEKNWLKQGGKI